MPARKKISASDFGPEVRLSPQVPKRSKRVDVEGFGCPCTDWPHHVRVVIPEVRGGDVRIVEAFGIGAHAAGQPDEIERCILPRTRWNAIADAASPTRTSSAFVSMPSDAPFLAGSGC